MLGKILIGLLVAAGAFLVYSLFAGGTANAAGASGGAASKALGDFNKWVTGGQSRTVSDPTAKAWTNYAASLPKMDPKQTSAILATRKAASRGF